MKRQTILRLSTLLVLCNIVGFTLGVAQTQDCLPSVALPPPSEANIFTPEQEIYLGEAVAEQIQKDHRILEDSELISYLSRVGQRIVEHLPLTQLRLQFFLVDLPDANAFVLPGGRIYVSRKLVAFAQSEDELAGVIAHELGHLAARESAIEITRRLKQVLNVTVVTDRSDVFAKYNELIDNARRKPGAFRAREREKGQMVADQIGFYALVKAGYDPAALARFWDRLTETKGKTGGWLSDLFGTTRPEERRLREMLTAVSKMPAHCIQSRAARQSDDFKKWQSAVITYAGMGRSEAVRGIVSKRQLEPPLRSDISHIRFSPDGKYVLAQDDSGINVLTREPFTSIFRIKAPDAYRAHFTPDSQSLVFQTDNLRVEYWSVTEKKMADVKEVIVRKGCLQTKLSADGKFLACLNPALDLQLLEVGSGKIVVQKKEFFAPNYYQMLFMIAEITARDHDSTDAGLDLINMNFSPDGRYFAAGYHGKIAIRKPDIDNVAEAIDLTTMAKVPLTDLLKKLIANGFTFMGNDRLVGINRENTKKSAMVTFPEGRLISEHELWRKNMTAATRGDYLLIRPIKDYALGVMEMTTKQIVKVSAQPAIDIFGDVLVSEMRNGQVGLYRMEKNELVATALLPQSSLGRLYVAELSPDMKWLALSGRSRGGVWNLNDGKAALYLRGFRGGYVSADEFFYGDFPAYETAERNVARFNLANGEVVPGPKLEQKLARQVREYVIVTRSAKAEVKDVEFVQRDKNVTIDMLDAPTMKPLWSKTYSKEAPRAWVASEQGTVALLWDLTDDAAKAEIKANARLSSQLAGMKEKEGDYFLQVLDVRTGNELGELLIETGKGSFRLSNVFAAGDWVIIADSMNRVLIYSLKTGEQKGKVFGGFATVAPKGGLLCVENESGKLAIYDLRTLEKREQFVFSSPVALVRFSEDGRKLFVLTSNQTAYVMDTSSLISSGQDRTDG